LEIVSAASFDQAVADSITLNGTVNPSLALGTRCTHVLSSTFTILNNTGSSGIAGTSSLLTWSGPEGTLTQGEVFAIGSNAFQISYTGGTGSNDVVLTAVVPEPGTVAALLGGTGVLLGVRRRRSTGR
jgi:hypothetical protein